MENETLSCQNLTQLVLRRIGENPQSPAFSYLEGGAWQTWSWSQFGEAVRATAAGLLSLGLKKGHRVVLHAPTSLPWIVLDTAILSLGGVSVPLHENMPLPEVSEVFRETQGAFLFIHGQNEWERFLQELYRSTSPQAVITEKKVLGDADFQVDFQDLQSRGLQGLGRLKMNGPFGSKDDLLFNASLQVEKDREAAIYCTSGTTGKPKLVSLTHGHFLAQIREIFEIFREEFGADSVAFSMLPYAHIFGRVEWLCHLAFGAHGYVGEGFENLHHHLQEAKPTIAFTVPRVLEKIRSRIWEYVQDLPGLKRKVAESSLTASPQEVGSLQSLLADKLVFSKIRGVLGGRLRTFVCAGAPLAPEVAMFFHTLGMKVIEAYGLTETAGAIAVTRGNPEEYGTVGKILPECEIRLASDQEILVKGPSVIDHYGPRGQETQDPESVGCFSPEGWFHTGDLGQFDERGNLVITGRKKDVIITSAGKTISPLKIEARFLENPLFEQFIIFGDQQPYLVALLTVNRGLLEKTPEVSPYLSEEEWNQHPIVRSLVRRSIETVNQQLASYETIKRFTILREPLRIDLGEMTYSLKPRRSVLGQKYAAMIAHLYRDEWTTG